MGGPQGQKSCYKTGGGADGVGRGDLFAAVLQKNRVKTL